MIVSLISSRELQVGHPHVALGERGGCERARPISVDRPAARKQSERKEKDFEATSKENFFLFLFQFISKLIQNYLKVIKILSFFFLFFTSLLNWIPFALPRHCAARSGVETHSALCVQRLLERRGDAFAATELGCPVRRWHFELVFSLFFLYFNTFQIDLTVI